MNNLYSSFQGRLSGLCLMLAFAMTLTGLNASGMNGAGWPSSKFSSMGNSAFPATPVVISGVTVEQNFCGSGGSITVTFSGGVGPYDITWTGGGSASGVSSPYTITGLASGTYTATVTDANASSATTSAQTISSYSVENQTSGAGYNDVQTAINAASPGDVIVICSGTYSSALTVNKKLDIRGQGTSTIIQNPGGTAITYTAAGSGSASGNRAYLRNLKIGGSTKGIYVDQLVNHLTLEGVSIDGNSSYGIHLNNISGVMNDWVLSNCTFNANSDGFRMGMAANLNGLSITGSTFTNQVSAAVYIPQQASSPGGCTNVTISGNTFTSNGSNVNNLAALYIEKLSNATISGNTFTNNGLNVNPRAISVNLKYGNYTNVTISGNSFVENRGAVQNTSGASIGYAMNVSGRNDAPSYSTSPATLSNVTISNNEVNGFIRGIQVENATDWNTTTIENNKLVACPYAIIGAVFPTGNLANATTTLEVHNNSISGATGAVVNASQSGGLIDATCNWFGTASVNTISTIVNAGVDYTPWLTSGTDNNAAIGFQPVPNSCTGTAPTFTSSVTNASCFGLSNGSINLTISGGTTPYIVSYNGNETSEDQTGLPAGDYTVVVTDANGSSASATITVGQPTIPSPAGAISGTAVDCVPGLAASKPFSVPSSTNAVTYTWTWTGSSGVTISNNGTQNINLNYTASAIQNGVVGTLTVTPVDVCGNSGVSSSVAVEYQVTQPVTPGSISGPGKLCPGDVVTYSVSPVLRAKTYNWIMPATMTIVSGTGTNIISVSVGNGYTGGTISVSASNNCGSSPTRSKSLVNNLPGTPGVISGISSGLCGANGVNYSIAAVTGATSYTWTVTGGSLSGSATGTLATVNWSSAVTSGTIAVSSVNACGTSSVRSLTVSMVPARPNPITGILNPACVNSNDTASIATVTGASSYTWQITSGGSIVGGQGTKDALVTWGPSAISSQAITVRAVNSCGTSLSRALAGISVVSCFNRLSTSAGQELEMEVFPNPANDWMQCSFRSETEQRYQIRLMDLSGRLVLVEEGVANTGLNRIELNPEKISSGAYMLQLNVGDQQSVQRIVIE